MKLELRQTVYRYLFPDPALLEHSAWVQPLQDGLAHEDGEESHSARDKLELAVRTVLRCGPPIELPLQYRASPAPQCPEVPQAFVPILAASVIGSNSRAMRMARRARGCLCLRPTRAPVEHVCALLLIVDEDSVEQSRRD